MKWSILICTLESRRALREKLVQELTRQILGCNLQDNIEIRWEEDTGQLSVGAKRNLLVAKSTGEYISFIDDDDEVNENYIKWIYEALLSYPDVVSLRGVMTRSGKNPRLFIHSITYTGYFEENNIYYRPPNHLNPIKKALIASFRFPETWWGEDTDWAMRVCRAGVLKTEADIPHTYYHYKFDPNTSETVKSMNRNKNQQHP